MRVRARALLLAARIPLLLAAYAMEQAKPKGEQPACSQHRQLGLKTKPKPMPKRKRKKKEKAKRKKKEKKLKAKSQRQKRRQRGETAGV